MADLVRGDTSLPEDTKLAQVAQMWLAEKSESTQTEYKRDLHAFLDWLSAPIEEVTLPLLQEYREWLLGQYAAQTAKRKLATIKSLFSFGADIGAFDMDPTRPLSLPDGENVGPGRILTREEVGRIIEAPTKRRDKVLIRTLYRAGLRASEAAGLTTGDLTASDDGPVLRVCGKGGNERSVRIPTDLYEDILEVSDGEPLFPSRDGGPLSRTSIWRIVKQAATIAGVKTGGSGGESEHDPWEEAPKQTSDVSPHWLRHAHASHALQNGASIELVRDTLGHSSIETTQQYLHAVPSESSSDFLAE